MRSAPNETTTLGYFSIYEKAERAARAAKEAGFDTVQIDRVKKYPGDGTEVRQSPLNSQFNSLANLTLGADIETKSEGILFGADPAASGMAGSSGVQARGILVTIVSPASRAGEAVSLLKEHGGEV